MDDKLFLIAIGGTGMRCLEAFVHMCAAGLFDGKEIEILTLDTDQSNGNKGSVEALIDLYNKVKTNDVQTRGGEARSNTFFSAKLNLYRFYTDYSKPERKTFSVLSSTRNLSDDRRVADQDLADLFFDRDTVQSFELDHGYRAQTHLGSLLMYHGIIEAARNAKKGGIDVKPQDKALKDFLINLNQNANNARVFVFGSVFGGTGASSIPVIPKALQDAVRIITGGANELNLNNVRFGSTLLTDYFTFNSPTAQQKEKEKVIADANNFALNSQAALNFYNNDSTVRRTYKRLYHVGWPAALRINYSEGKDGEVLTGGHDQKNPCHVAELMCAAAAYDFFNDESLNSPIAEYVFRTVELLDGGGGALRLNGGSFVGTKNAEIFENKLGALLSMAHLLLSKYGGAYDNVDGTYAFIKELDNRKIYSFNDLTVEQAREIDTYLKEFAYQFTGMGMEPGWIYQIYKSVGNGSFIFSPEAFPTDVGALSRVDPGVIFRDDRHNWEAKGYFGFKTTNRFDPFVNIVRSEDAEPTDEQGVTVKERFLAHLYNAITIAQNFNS